MHNQSRLTLKPKTRLPLDDIETSDLRTLDNKIILNHLDSLIAEREMTAEKRFELMMKRRMR